MKELVIRNIPLFSNLPEPEVEYLARHLSEENVPAGTLIFREGEPGEYLLVVLSGELEIVKELGSPDERIVALRTTGDHIGEMSLDQPGGHAVSERAYAHRCHDAENDPHRVR